MIRLLRLQPTRRLSLYRSTIGIRPLTSTTPKLKLFQNPPRPTTNSSSTTTTTGKPTTTTTTTTTTTQQPSLQERQIANHPILKRVPKFLRSYAARFINAPFSHLVSFIILHELTAIVPLISLWYFFHSHPNYVPVEIPTWALDQGAKVIDYVLSKVTTDWEINSKEKMQIIIEGAYAFTIIKFLIPVRVVVSLYFMPWFAKWFVVPILNIFGNFKKILQLRKSRGNNRQAFDQVKTKKINKPRL